MKKIISIIENIGVFFLIDIAITLLISTILFFFHIGITPYHFLFSLIVSAMIFYQITKKEIEWKELGITILLSLILILGFMFLQSKFYDMSYDGNAYHKDAIGLLKNGWNPVYDKVEDYYKKINIRPSNFEAKQSLWEEHYAKAGWIYSSTIYALTDNIESGKAINFIMYFSCFALFLGCFYKKWEKIIPALLIAVIASFTPVTIMQSISYYNDSLLGVTLYMFILSLIQFIVPKGKPTLKLYAQICSLLIIGINIKFTGLAYLGIFAIGLYFYYMYMLHKEKKLKEIKKPTIVFVTTTVIAIFIVGFSSYVTNTIDHHHPFYPLFGKNKVDIMTDLQPASFEHMPTIKKFIYATFSSTDDILKNSGREPQLKNPFSATYSELMRVSIDTRIGGWGVLFGGIFILSIGIIGLHLLKIKEKNKFECMIFLIVLGTSSLLICFLTDGWWARYAPYVYLFVLFSLYVVLDTYVNNKNRNTFAYMFGYSMLILLNLFLLEPSFHNYLKHSSVISDNLNKFANKKNAHIVMTDGNFNGILYNLDDIHVTYCLSYKADGTEHYLYDYFLQTSENSCKN